MDSDSTPSFLGVPSTIEDPLWYPDTGATHHITKDSKFFTHKQPYHSNDDLKLGNEQGTSISHTGYAIYTDPHSHTIFKLHKMLHVPAITKNLISVAQFSKDNNVYFEFHANLCYVKNQETHQILLQGVIKDGLYVFPPSLSTPAPSVYYASYKPKIPLLQFWHNRLGHCNITIVKHVLNDCHISYPSQTHFSDPCIQGKLHQLLFQTSVTQYTEPLQLIFIDIWGPAPVCASSGACYYISFLDAHTKYTWLFLIHNKSQALNSLIRFKTFAENQTGFKLRVIPTDNAKEFLCFKPFTQLHGIFHRLTCPHTHAQNGSSNVNTDTFRKWD